ncbi:hypothetical protein JCM11641_001548 [Rhodosporidiobolus odoratus]
MLVPSPASPLPTPRSLFSSSSASPEASLCVHSVPASPRKCGEIGYHCPSEPSPVPDWSLWSSTPLPPVLPSTPPPANLTLPPFRRPLFGFILCVALMVSTVVAWITAGIVLSRKKSNKGVTPWVTALMALVLVVELWYMWRAAKRLYVPIRRRQLETDPSGLERAGKGRRLVERYCLSVKAADLTPAAPPFPPAPAYPAGEMSMVEAARLARSSVVVQFATPVYDSAEMHSTIVIEEGPPPDPRAASSSTFSPSQPSSPHSPTSTTMTPNLPRPSTGLYTHLRRRSSLALSSHTVSGLSPPPSPDFNRSTDSLLTLPLPALRRQTSRASTASASSGTSRCALLRSALERDVHWDARGRK